MKLLSLFLVSVCLLLSCNKHTDDKPGTAFIPTLIAQTWIYDSSRLFFPDTNFLITSPRPDIMLNFTDSFWISTHPVNTKDTFRYEFIIPDTLHRWQPPNTKDPLEYFLLNKVTD